MSQHTWSARDRIVISAAVFSLAIIVRLLHVWSIADAPFFALHMGDAAEHHQFGLAAAAGDWLGSGVFFHAPLYPYFLGVTYSVFGSDAMGVRVIQAVLGGFSCVFVAQAAGRLFTRREAIAAGVLLALYGPAIFYDTIFQDSVLDLFFACLVLWAIVEVVRTRSSGALFAAGLSLGALSLTRENGIILAVPLFGWLVLQPTLSLRRKAISTAIVLAGLALALIPAAVRDAIVTGDIGSGDQFRFGVNLYIGNNPQADGYYRPVREGRGNPRFEMQDWITVAERNAGRPLTEAEVSDYWVGQTLQYVTREPADWLALTARKTALVLNTAEPPDTEGPYIYMEHSPVLAITMRVFGFGLLLALAVLGVFVTWPDRRRLLLFYVMPPLYLATVVAFLIFGRYRHPVAPYLIILAAPAVVGMRTYVREWRRPAVATGLAAAVVTLVLAHAPIGSSRADFRAHTHANVGATLEEQGDYEGAAREYWSAIRIDPSSAQAYQFLGNLLRRAGRPEIAEPYLALAVKNDPTSADVRNDYGAVLAALGRNAEAKIHLERAVSWDPDLVAAHLNLGAIALRSADPSAAVMHFQRAVGTHPGDLDARRLLITALLMHGKAAAATAQADTVTFMTSPDTARELIIDAARAVIERTGLSTRQADGVIELLRNAPEIVPRDARYYRILAAGYAAAGRFEGAVGAVQRALAVTGNDVPDATASGSEREVITRRELEDDLELYRNGRLRRAP